MKPLSLSKQMEKAQLLIAGTKGLEDAAEFLKGFNKKWDVVKNKATNGKRKNI